MSSAILPSLGCAFWSTRKPLQRQKKNSIDCAAGYGKISTLGILDWHGHRVNFMEPTFTSFVVHAASTDASFEVPSDD